MHDNHRMSTQGAHSMVVVHVKRRTGGRNGTQEGPGCSEGTYKRAENQCAGVQVAVPGSAREGSRGGGCMRTCAEYRFNRCASVHKGHKTSTRRAHFVPLVHEGRRHVD
jgi:hypothetical protein